MEFDFLMMSPLFEEILAFFDFAQIARMELVSRSWRRSICTESVWRRIASSLFATQNYIPPVCLRLCTAGNTRALARHDLQRLSVKSLKQYCVDRQLDYRHCLEKSDIVDLLDAFDLQFAYDGEPLAKFGVRIMWLDRRRNTPTQEELCSLQWRIRVRSDGPLRMLVAQDPYWSGQEATCLSMDMNGTIVFQQPNMFSANLNFAGSAIGFRLTEERTSLRLSIGVEEQLTRHPVHGGWMCMSNGTVWTGFAMPPLASDPYMVDEVINSLLYPKNTGFFHLTRYA